MAHDHGHCALCDQQEAELDVKRAVITRLNAWVDDLQSGMFVNCVYCGHQYGPGETTPVSMADALKAHVERCPKHPMSALRARVRVLEAALRRLHHISCHVAENTQEDDPALPFNVEELNAALDEAEAALPGESEAGA